MGRVFPRRGLWCLVIVARLLLIQRVVYSCRIARTKIQLLPLMVKLIIIACRLLSRWCRVIFPLFVLILRLRRMGGSSGVVSRRFGRVGRLCPCRGIVVLGRRLVCGTRLVLSCRIIVVVLMVCRPLLVRLRCPQIICCPLSGLILCSRCLIRFVSTFWGGTCPPWVHRSRRLGTPLSLLMVLLV